MAYQTNTPSSGIWLMLGSTVVAERLARSGVDWICLDAQHGAYTDASLLDSLRTAEGAEVRVRLLDGAASSIGRALDLGAQAVVVPMVQSAADARDAARAAAYPPEGERSWGPLAGLRGVEPVASPRLWLMIETARALDAVEEIAAVDGPIGLFVGPFDLALSLGTTVDALLADEDGPLARIRRAAHAHGRLLSAFAGTPERAARLRELGFPDVAVATDASLLDLGLNAAVGARSGSAYGS